MTRTKIKKLIQMALIGDKVCVKGWVKTKRVSKEVIFITLNDGSTQHSLQIVTTPSNFPEKILQQIVTGASLCVEGEIVTSQGKSQNIDLQALKILVLGTATDYPLQPKRHSNEFLREISHLRFRTNTFGAVFRIRHTISYAIHHFFHQRGFYYLHTPIITGTDAEGAGEMFRVTTLDLASILKQSNKDVNFTKDFFGQDTHLTVSGQLAAEAAAMGLGEVYTFGPTFRAENSNTTRHLAEFWMIEPEVAFNDLTANIVLAETLLKYVLHFVLDHCKDDLAWLQQRVTSTISSPQKEKGKLIPLIEQLQLVASTPFENITYTEAIAILKNSRPNKKGEFFFPVANWGMNLQSEHERYLVEEHFKKPVIVTNYPKAIKAFYMRQNDGEDTVAAMDILFPKVGEIIGGSQREERLDKLCEAIQHMEVDKKALQWYLDTRLFGTAPHSGFGLGLERFVQFITGMDNIRDVIPFPRTPGHAAY